MAENTLKEIKDYLGQNKPLGGEEFRNFWNGLTEEEKNEYKNADLS